MGFLAALSSPVFRYIAIGVAVIGFISWQRHDAAQDARIEAEAECVQDALDAAAAERDRLQRAMEETLAEAERSRIEAEREVAQLREMTDGLLEELEGSGQSCPIPSDLLRRLRGIE